MSDSSKHQLNRQICLSLRIMTIAWVAVLAIACQDSPPSESSPPDAATSSPAASSTAVSDGAESTVPGSTAPSRASSHYANESFGFSFAYPDDFVLVPLIEDTNSPAPDAAPITLDLWQREQYQSIQAGDYEAGTEYPPNVQITVYRKGDRLSLQEWIDQSDRFVLRSEIQTRSVAGQEALTFHSEGLYSHQNVVLPGQTEREVIVISLAQISVPELDEPNQRAFEQVVSTFQLKSE